MSMTAREIMSGGTECVPENSSVTEAAKKMASLEVGALPICGEDDRLKGMLTDRDIVIKVIAEDFDPDEVKAGQLGQGNPVTIGADDPIEEAIETMKAHAVRRLPVIDGHRLVGVVSQGDIAAAASPEELGDLVGSISTT